MMFHGILRYMGRDARYDPCICFAEDLKQVEHFMICFWRDIRRICVLLVLMLVLAGCTGRNEELNTYKDKMERFFGVISLYDENMNAIDPMAEDAEETLLYNLDNMDRAFTEMATYEIPEEFSMLGELPAEAAFYMSEAVKGYHLAYDGDYDAEAEQKAKDLYDRANRRLQYIITILHGEIPEGEDVEFVEEGTGGSDADE